MSTMKLSEVPKDVNYLVGDWDSDNSGNQTFICRKEDARYYLEEGYKLWMPEEVRIRIDVSWWVESACEDLGLHEGAYDSCDIDSLQDLVDEWCKKQTATTTYFTTDVQVVL